MRDSSGGEEEGDKLLSLQVEPWAAWLSRECLRVALAAEEHPDHKGGGEAEGFAGLILRK